MLAILKYVFWIGAVTVFMASGWFVKVLVGIGGIIVTANDVFWGKIPSEFQWIILGFISAVIFLAIRVFTKD